MRPVCLLVRTKNLRQSDGLHFISDSLECVKDRLHVCKGAELTETEHTQLLIVTRVDLLLSAPALKLLIPKLPVLNLMDGENDKVERIALKKFLVARNRVCLHPELHAETNADLPRIFLLHGTHSIIAAQIVRICECTSQQKLDTKT